MTSCVCCEFELDQIILCAHICCAHHSVYAGARWVNPACTCTAPAIERLPGFQLHTGDPVCVCVLHYEKLVSYFIHIWISYTGLKQCNFISAMTSLLGEWETWCHWSLLLFFFFFYLSFVWYCSLLYCSRTCTQIQVRFQGCLYPVFIHSKAGSHFLKQNKDLVWLSASAYFNSLKSIAVLGSKTFISNSKWIETIIRSSLKRDLHTVNKMTSDSLQCRIKWRT